MSALTSATDAVVLDCRDHGEADLIVTFLSPLGGKSVAIAKHAKKSKQRFVNKLELFSFLHIFLRRRNPHSLALLQEAELYNSFIHLRQQIPQYIAASVIREFLLAVIHEEAKEERLFKLTLWALHMLDSQHTPQTVIALFLPRFFEYIGYRPEFGRCLVCDSPLTNQNRQEFSISGGCVLCPPCISSSNHSLLSVSAGTLRFLQASQDEPLERLHRLKASGMILAESLNLLHRYGNHLLRRDIQSWKMLVGLGQF